MLALKMSYDVLSYVLLKGIDRELFRFSNIPVHLRIARSDKIRPGLHVSATHISYTFIRNISTRVRRVKAHPHPRDPSSICSEGSEVIQLYIEGSPPIPIKRE